MPVSTFAMLTDLHEAIIRGDLKTIRALIEQGADVNTHVYDLLTDAVKYNNQYVVDLLIPHCNSERAFASLEIAIFMGFHNIADRLLHSQKLKYPQRWSSDSEYSKYMKFPDRKGPEALEQWKRFISSRGPRLDNSTAMTMDPLYLEYLLVLTAKDNEETDFLLDLLEFFRNRPSLNIDVNGKIKVEDHLETALTAAAEQGNADVIQFLLGYREIKGSICGKYHWPAFMHLLGNKFEQKNLEWANFMAEQMPKI